MLSWQMSAIELAAEIRAGFLSATEVMAAHLERIKAVNPALNAITNVLADQAMAAAVEIDRRRSDGEQLGVLVGVPFTVKEDIDVEGLATTFGVPRLQHLMAAIDAPPVRRLRAADAIPIGRTNLSDSEHRRYPHRQPTLRRHKEPLGRDEDPRWFKWRRCSCRGHWHGGARIGQRLRWVDPLPGHVLRSSWAEAELWAFPG